MQDELHAITDALEKGKRHFFLIEGNISDKTLNEGNTYDSLLDYIESRTKDIFLNFVLYDVFSGISVVRGNQSEIFGAFGINHRASSSSGTRDPLREALSSGKKNENDKSAEEWTVSLDPSTAFQLFNRLFTSREKLSRTAIVLTYPEACVPMMQNGDERKKLSVALQKWSLDEKIHKQGHTVIVLAHSLTSIDHDIYSNRCSCMFIERVSKPQEEKRIEFLGSLGTLPQTAKVVGKGTSGLSLKEIERIYAELPKGKSDDYLLDECFRAKQTILQEEYGDVVEILDTTWGFNAIGGLEKPIAKLQEIAGYMREGERSLVPQGIGFYGPPGTGKTLLATALAREARINCVKKRDLKNSLVGQSEKNLTRFHNALRDLAPLIVFNDEYDQAQVSRGSFEGDSGVSKDFLKKELEIMSDPNLVGRVLFITASNRLDLIDTALKRAGRCDLRIPFPPFDANTLAKICRAALVQNPEIKSDIHNFLPFTERCGGYNGADMIVIVKRAWEHAYHTGRKAIIDEDMEWACGDYIPQIANEPEIALMTLLAFRESSSMSLLPDNWQEMHDTYSKILMRHYGTGDLDEICSSSGNSRARRI